MIKRIKKLYYKNKCYKIVEKKRSALMNPLAVWTGEENVFGSELSGGKNSLWAQFEPDWTGKPELY